MAAPKAKLCVASARVVDQKFMASRSSIVVAVQGSVRGDLVIQDRIPIGSSASVSRDFDIAVDNQQANVRKKENTRICHGYGSKYPR
jgi:predicted glycosyltransferase